jgi:cell division protein FtsL
MPEDRRKRHHTEASGYYIDGNTVRKIETVPEIYPEEQERLTEAERKRRAELRKKRAIAKRNRERAARMDLTYTVFLVISVVVTVAACVVYLNLQNEITRTNEQIASLEARLSAITNENLAMEERINSAIDLAKVYNMAVHEFGMTAITEGQIYYYSNDNEDYVKQYEHIPTEN